MCYFSRIVPICCSVDHESRLISFTVSGTITADEIVDAIDSVLPQLDSCCDYDVISDHRELQTPATPAQITRLVEHLVTHGQRLHGRRAAIIVASEASYGMMRMLAVRAEKAGILVGVFWDLQTARDCLREHSRFGGSSLN